MFVAGALDDAVVGARLCRANCASGRRSRAQLRSGRGGSRMSLWPGRRDDAAGGARLCRANGAPGCCSRSAAALLQAACPGHQAVSEPG